MIAESEAEADFDNKVLTSVVLVLDEGREDPLSVRSTVSEASTSACDPKEVGLLSVGA